MTASLQQPNAYHWSRDHRQDLADLAAELHRTGDDHLASLAEQALADTEK